VTFIRHVSFGLFSILGAINVLLLFAVSSTAMEFTQLTTPRLRLIDVIQATLAKQPVIILSKEQLNQSSASIDLALAEFDWKLDTSLIHVTDYKPSGALLLYESIATTALDLRFNKKTKYGFTLEPGITFKSAYTDVINGAGNDSLNANTFRLFFNVNVPLLQGYGQQVTTANETSARFLYEASRYELLHTISLSANDTISAYWDYTAAYEKLRHAITVEERAISIVASTESLVNADELAQSELTSAQANLLEKKIAHEHAELTLVATRQRLGLITGITDNETTALQLPADQLPNITSEIALRALSARQYYFDKAYKNRGDLLALGQKTKSSEQLLLAAKDATKPKLDLVAGIGYDGYQTGSQFKRVTQSVENRQNAPDWSIGVRYSYPLENRGANGNQAIIASQLNQAKIRQLDLQRTTEITISSVLYSLQNVAREIEKAEMTVTSYQKSVDNEREKYLMGESTLFDLIFVQDRLDAAQLSKIDARYRGALLLTRLQFEAGMMLDCHATDCELNADSVAILLEPTKRNDP
jgi:outer membrane protein TolC